MIRSAKITIEYQSGIHIIEQAQMSAQNLWNDMVSTYFRQGGSYNVCQRYPGFNKLDKVMRKHWAGIHLSDRCFSYTVKDFDIAVKSWFSNLKSNPDARPPKFSGRRTLTFEVGRNAKAVGNMEYELTSLGGRKGERKSLVRLRIRPGVKMSEISLIKILPDGTGAVVYRKPDQPIAGEGIAAIDLGIINIVTMAFEDGQSILVSGKGLLSAVQWGAKRSAKCKPKNWHPGAQNTRPSKKSRAYTSKAANKRKLAVHNLTRFIIDECVKRGVTTLVVGDLKGIRDNADHGKRGNQKLHQWPFYQITEQLKYKGDAYGVTVKKVSERNTSKCCHRCGNKGIRSPRGMLTCKTCNVVINSDVNGAFGILNKVSPVPVYAGVGVEAIFSGPQSLAEPAQGICKLSQIHPTFATKFDLRNWSMKELVNV